MVSATTANRKPTPMPTMMSVQPAGGGEDAVDEGADRRRRRIAEIGDIDRLRDREPDEEDRHQQEPERDDGAERARAQHVEGVDRRLSRPASRRRLSS